MSKLSAALLSGLLLLFTLCSATENYIVHVQQGTGDWSFVSFYPLRLSVRPNDTVTFTQDFDYGIIAVTPSSVNLAATTTFVADPTSTYFNSLSVPTDGAESGYTVVSDPTQSYSAGILYSQDVLLSQGISGRSNWTFEMTTAGLFTFHELFQEMSILIEVTAELGTLLISADDVEVLMQEKMLADRNRIPGLISAGVEPYQTPQKDSKGRWVVHTGWLEEPGSDPSQTGLAVYNRFIPGPSINIEGDVIYFTNIGAHPHAVAFNGSGDVLQSLLPFTFDAVRMTYKESSVYVNQSALNNNGQAEFTGNNFLTSGVLDKPGAAFEIKFTAAGSMLSTFPYRYVCYIHAHLEMEAIVVVTPSSTSSALRAIATTSFTLLFITVACLLIL